MKSPKNIRLFVLIWFTVILGISLLSIVLFEFGLNSLGAGTGIIDLILVVYVYIRVNQLVQNKRTEGD